MSQLDPQKRMGTASFPVARSVNDGRGVYLQASAAGDPAMILNEALFTDEDYDVITRDEASHALKVAVTFLDEWVADGPQWQDPSGLDRVHVFRTITDGSQELTTEEFKTDQNETSFLGIVYDFARVHRYRNMQWSYGESRMAERSTFIDTASQANAEGNQRISFTGRLGFTHRGTHAVSGENLELMQYHSFSIDLERGRSGYRISKLELTALV